MPVQNTTGDTNNPDFKTTIGDAVGDTPEQEAPNQEASELTIEPMVRNAVE